ncbi:hypothetical protein EU545_02255 [Candidatus Thorarchaeota archaeon]|nr:MAG: hypothetical protein EU545_02255 [Candidatus Thorarchaeota archaeon]
MEKRTLQRLHAHLTIASLILSLLGPVSIVANDTTGAPTPTIELTPILSIERNWDNLSLLYPDQYHDADEVEDEIANIAQAVPELVDLEVIGQSYLGRDISCLRITNEQSLTQQAKTLVVAHHHAREQITIEAALRLILYLLNGYGEDEQITAYIDTEEIFVIPTLNPDSLEYVVNQGNHWLRKNLRPYDNDGDGEEDEDPLQDVDGDGWISSFETYAKNGDDLTYISSTYEGVDDDGDGLVNEDGVGLTDLNRNYPTYWSPSSANSNDPASQVYRGSSPFSEPETQALRDLVLEHEFAMAYSLHSGINATYFSTNSVGNWVEPVLYSRMIDDLESILPESFNEGLGYPSREKLAAHGDLATHGGMWKDWMYQERGTVAPICFEIYHNGSVDDWSFYEVIEENSTHVLMKWDGIFGYFAPFESHIDALWNEIRPAFDYLLATTPRLQLSTPSVSGGTSEGSTVTISCQIECLSDRLTTQGDINFLTTDGGILAHSGYLSPGQSLSRSAQITLPQSITTSNLTILLGNDYTGYHALVLSSSNGSPTDPPPEAFPWPMVIALLAIAAVTVVLIVIWRARR